MRTVSFPAHLLQLLPYITRCGYGDIAIFFFVKVIKRADSNLKFVNTLTSQLPPAHFITVICQGRPATADNMIPNPAWAVIEQCLAVC